MPYDVAGLSQAIRAQTGAQAQRATQREQSIITLGRFFSSGFDVAAWHAALAQRLANDAPQSLVNFDGDEAANGQFGFGHEPQQYALLACDGSQILPNRHAPAVYGLIQAASVCIGYGLNTQQHTHCEAAQTREHRLKTGDDLLEDGELISPGTLMNERDMLEIELLAKTCAALTAQGIRCVALVDGSILPFALIADKSGPEQTTRLVAGMTHALNSLKASRALLAGYIDRPNSITLAGTIAAGMGLSAKSEAVTDADVVAPHLGPDARTALFEPGWKSKGVQRLAQSGHALRACYANFGSEARPYLVRLELPVWCADEVGTALAIARRQAQASAGDPYPFILKAAHEQAVLSKDDQREIDNMMQRELMTHGMTARASAKQVAKDLR